MKVPQFGMVQVAIVVAVEVGVEGGYFVLEAFGEGGVGAVGEEGCDAVTDGMVCSLLECSKELAMERF